MPTDDAGSDAPWVGTVAVAKFLKLASDSGMYGGAEDVFLEKVREHPDRFSLDKDGYLKCITCNKFVEGHLDSDDHRKRWSVVYSWQQFWHQYHEKQHAALLQRDIRTIYHVLEDIGVEVVRAGITGEISINRKAVGSLADLDALEEQREMGGESPRAGRTAPAGTGSTPAAAPPCPRSQIPAVGDDAASTHGASGSCVLTDPSWATDSTFYDVQVVQSRWSMLNDEINNGTFFWIYVLAHHRLTHICVCWEHDLQDVIMRAAGDQEHWKDDLRPDIGSFFKFTRRRCTICI